MNIDDILMMVDKRGGIVKDIFFTKFAFLIDNWFLTDGCKVVGLAIVSYNFTISMLKDILDNPEFYERVCHIKERNRKRIIKDLEKMSPIDYSDDYGSFDLKNIEENMVLDSIMYRLNYNPSKI